MRSVRQPIQVVVIRRSGRKQRAGQCAALRRGRVSTGPGAARGSSNRSGAARRVGCALYVHHAPEARQRRCGGPASATWAWPMWAPVACGHPSSRQRASHEVQARRGSFGLETPCRQAHWRAQRSGFAASVGVLRCGVRARQAARLRSGQRGRLEARVPQRHVDAPAAAPPRPAAVETPRPKHRPGGERLFGHARAVISGRGARSRPTWTQPRGATRRDAKAPTCDICDAWRRLAIQSVPRIVRQSLICPRGADAEGRSPAPRRPAALGLTHAALPSAAASAFTIAGAAAPPRRAPAKRAL